MHIHPSPIHYHINVSSIPGHVFDVRLHIKNPDENGQILTLPAWIPGSYMIRDFAKNIVKISAQDDMGTDINIQKLDKQTWQAQAVSTTLTIQYQIYAFDLSVRSAYINDEMAFLNGTNMFLAVVGQTDQPCGLTLQKPVQPELSHWQVATTMPTEMQDTHAFGEYYADNYEGLIDHPVLMGEFDILPFSAAGVEFELILAGGHQADVQRITKDLTKVCQHHIDFFADTPPVKRYQFITLLTDNAFGGLEHMSSTALMYSRNDLPSLSDAEKMTDGYRVFLSLCSHEFFHTWHVKRIKPEELFGAALDKERYTEQLWIYEGFTSYYDDFSLLRCGLITQTEYLKVVGQNLTRLLRNKGRFKQTITESSFDAWTKFYKQDESAVNNIVSYYNKGAVLAMCLDLLIKSESDGNYSLDDVMRNLWEQYGKLAIPTPVDVIQNIVKTQLNLDLNAFFQSALYSTEELPFNELLEKFGVECHFLPRENLDDKGGEMTTSPIKIDFGAQIKMQEIGVQIIQVTEQTAAYESGLQVGDVLIAINKWVVSKENLIPQLNHLTIGQTVQLNVIRDKKLKPLTFLARAASKDTIALEVIEQQQCNRWLS
ncbi:M61 family metallopeptidase [Paraglaciecola psychrophila]|uniref:Peptidase M61 n=1 Tax=Paraglaciecola psychrophila 170 TaxID=1129794 RepID=K7AS00_9ALTE|nr:PDZ domain-containing protein [Paraglaciecola psychrophila]AGH45383.1 peptidase M61 [Paraglaciecola psychrophila 170]GAC38055.1 peptidase M61 domain-containing protein [Paraglaciecola psychrophila 170]